MSGYLRRAPERLIPFRKKCGYLCVRGINELQFRNLRNELRPKS